MKRDVTIVKNGVFGRGSQRVRDTSFGDEFEMYNLDEDRFEMVNLAPKAQAGFSQDLEVHFESLRISLDMQRAQKRVQPFDRSSHDPARFEGKLQRVRTIDLSYDPPSLLFTLLMAAFTALQLLGLFAILSAPLLLLRCCLCRGWGKQQKATATTAKEKGKKSDKKEEEEGHGVNADAMSLARGQLRARQKQEEDKKEENKKEEEKKGEKEGSSALRQRKR